MAVKIRSSAAEAIADLVEDGMTIAVGGFGLSGNPTNLIQALRDTGAKDLTIVSNNMGVDGKGLGLLLENQQVRKVLSSYVGENKLFASQYLDGTLDVEFVPQRRVLALTLGELILEGGDERARSREVRDREVDRRRAHEPARYHTGFADAIRIGRRSRHAIVPVGADVSH